MIKISILTALVAVLILANTAATYAGRKDTPEDVIRAAQKAAVHLKKMEDGLKVAQAIASHLQERRFAVQILELAKKNDRKGLAELLKKEVPTIEQIRIISIADFYFYVSVEVNGKHYDLCIGDCKHPSGAKSPVVFSESRGSQ